MIRARLDDGCAPLALLIHPQFGQMKYWNGVSNALRATGLARDVAADLLGEFHRRLCDRALRCAESYMASCLERNRINYEACDTISRLLRNMIVTGSAGIVASDTQNIVEGSQGSSQWHAVVTYRSTPAMGEFVSPKFFVPTYDLKSHAGMQREMDENAEQYRVLVWTMALTLAECQTAFREHLDRRFRPLDSLDLSQTWMEQSASVCQRDLERVPATQHFEIQPGHGSHNDQHADPDANRKHESD